jgi:hypothetical protein
MLLPFSLLRQSIYPILFHFYIDYKIDCPSKNKSGYLTIGGDYYGWFYKYDIIDHATGMELYTVYEGYYNTKSSVIINIK